MKKYIFSLTVAAVALAIGVGDARASATTTVIAGPAFVSAISTSSCPYITTFMKVGGKNNAVEVSKLQSFLKMHEGLDADVTGTFDDKTAEAVRAFQRKYMSDILGPWSATKPSGAVYTTTSKKINQLVCARPLTLNAAELAAMDSVKQRLANGTSTANTVTIVANPAVAVAGPSKTDIATDSVDFESGGDGSQNANVSAVGNAPILQRFWSFLGGLFR